MTSSIGFVHRGGSFLFRGARPTTLHFDGHRHPQAVRGKSTPRAGDWNGLVRVARHPHADEPAVSDDPVRGIELDPPRPGQKYPHPRMGVAAANAAFLAIGVVEVAGDESGC